MGKIMSRNVLRPTRKKVVGYGYVGLWRDGVPGWCLPENIYPGESRRYAMPCAAHPDWSNIGEPSYLCKITIEVVDGVRMRRIKEQ